MRNPHAIETDLDIITRRAQGLRKEYRLAYRVSHERGKGESVRISGSHSHDEVLDVIISKESARKAVAHADRAIDRAERAMLEASNELAKVVGPPTGERARDRAKLITDLERDEANRYASKRRERGETYGS